MSHEIIDLSECDENKPSRKRTATARYQEAPEETRISTDESEHENNHPTPSKRIKAEKRVEVTVTSHEEQPVDSRPTPSKKSKAATSASKEVKQEKSGPIPSKRSKADKVVKEKVVSADSNSKKRASRSKNAIVPAENVLVDLTEVDDVIVLKRTPSEKSIENKKQRLLLKNRTLKCTACAAGNDAEFVHPILSIPICGNCNKNVLDQAFSKTETGQELRCLWCGDGKCSFLAIFFVFFFVFSYFFYSNSEYS